MTFTELKSLLEQIARAVAQLRRTLETNNMDALPEALEQTRVALELINGYPEGPEKLKADINQYPEEQKQVLHSLLDQASVGHQINGDLIRLAMQRSAAMQRAITPRAHEAGVVPGARLRAHRDGGAVVIGRDGGDLALELHDDVARHVFVQGDIGDAALVTGEQVEDEAGLAPVVAVQHEIGRAHV